MDTAAWQQLESCFFEALELEAEAREAWLAKLEEEDAGLAARVRRLLDGDQGGGWIRASVEMACAQSPLFEEPGGDPVRRQIGPYRLIRELGRGGLGTVHLAERDDREFRQRVAIKLIKRGMDTDQIIRRLRQERQILAGLNHPNIARLLDGGSTEDGLPYFVMELIEGEPILEFCDRRRLDLEQRLLLLIDVCVGVEFAHRSLVIHRDLKSSNILITGGGEPKLVDFGIAKLLDTDHPRSQLLTTLPGLRVLSPDCASPEQIRGEPLTTATDVYSLGVLLCRLLTGRPPYELTEITATSLERTICGQAPRSPSALARRLDTMPNGLGASPAQLARRLSGDLDHIVLKALRKEPGERYLSVQELAADLRRHLSSEPVLARQGARSYRLMRFVRRHRAAVALASVFVFSLLAITAVAVYQKGLADRALQESEDAIDLLEDMLVQPAPGQSLSESTTLGEVLDGQADVLLRSELSPRATARAAEVIAALQYRVGRYGKALELWQRTAGIHRRQGSHVALIESLEPLGESALAAGRYDEAQDAWQEALGLLEREPGRRHLRPELLNSLAVLAATRGRNERAQELLEEAFLLESESGVATVTLGDILDNQAQVLQRQGRREPAEAILRQALRVHGLAMGEDHPKTAATKGRLASLLTTMLRLEEAETLYHETLEIQSKTLVAHHSEVLNTRLNYAALLKQSQRIDEAEAQLSEIISRLEPRDDHDPQLLSYAQNQLADLCRQRLDAGDFERSERLYEASLEIRQRLYGESDLRVSSPMYGLGRLYLAAGSTKLAEPYLRSTVEIREVGLTPPHRHLADALGSWGQSLLELGRFEQARQVLARSLEQQQALGRSQEAESVRQLLERLENRPAQSGP